MTLSELIEGVNARASDRGIADRLTVDSSPLDMFLLLRKIRDYDLAPLREEAEQVVEDLKRPRV